MNYSMYEENSNDSFATEGGAIPAVGATIVSPSLMFVAGVSSNILALIILFRHRADMRTVKFYRLAQGLVWTDLLGIVFTTPSVLAAYLNRGWIGGDVHCRFHGFTMTCFGLATPFIICAMSLDRFLALKCVFFYTGKCSSSVAMASILCIWIFVVLFGTLPLIGFGQFTRQYPGTWCFVDVHSHEMPIKLYAYLYASIHIALIILMLTCNAVVVYYLAQRFCQKRAKAKRLSSIKENVEIAASPESVAATAAPSTTASHRKCRAGDVEMYSIVFLCALSTVFAVCWGPFMVGTYYVLDYFTHV